MILRRAWIPVLLMLALASGCAAGGQRLFISLPVVDLRAQPATAIQANTHDPLEESQLLFGEEVRVVKQAGGWSYIEALEQPEFSHHKSWQGYPGWVPDAAITALPDLAPPPNLIVTAKWALAWDNGFRTGPPVQQFPLGTKLAGISFGGQLWKINLNDHQSVWLKTEDAQRIDELQALPGAQRRRLILYHAAKFLGDPYLWGGRSPYGGAPAHSVTGVDCSGLVSLAYRAVGLDIPRDAHEQFLRAHPVPTPQPGDLIFLSAAEDPRRIVHVMLYAGEGMILEAPGTGLTVRRISATQRLGRPVEQIQTGTVVDKQTVYFGSYLP